VNKPARSSRLFSISVRRAAARGRITTTEDEWFYILEGQVSFLMNGTWTDMLPGTCIYSPRGTVHAFKNNTDQPIRVFINIAPAGFERFFAEVAEEWAQPERDTSRMTAISKKYGIHSV
jgi:mannose-6-phosphate isomerase-like protein (cupin superfamily)